MNPKRREALRLMAVIGLMASTGLISQAQAAEWNKAAFDGKTLADTYKAMGAEGAKESGEVQLLASDIAENGAVVPLQAVSKLPNTTQISFLVEKNPNMLAASFDISPAMVSKAA